MRQTSQSPYHRAVEKQFNTVGPTHHDIHYTLTPSGRINWPELSSLIDAQKYFILHAPRQTDKTSLMVHLTRTVNAEGKCRGNKALCQWTRTLIKNPQQRCKKIWLDTQRQPPGPDQHCHPYA